MHLPEMATAANHALLCKNGCMAKLISMHRMAIIAWIVLSALGCLWLGNMALGQLREGFETDARIVHRLLSQRAVQHDAIMATLALLQAASGADHPESRLTSVYPQILAVQRRDRDTRWEDPRFAAADVRSRTLKRAVMVDADFVRGRYWLVLAADSSYALQIDMRGFAPWSEWPMQPASSPVRVTLEVAGQHFVLQAGSTIVRGWRFDFSKHLASDSQPFDVVAVRHLGWLELPWGWMFVWLAVVAMLLAGLTAVRRQRAARRRAEELLRLGQVARLNTLGELAAGMAHEVNQPLAAILANTQAASRLLAESPPDVETARSAMTHAVQQAQRAAAVVGRLRRAVELPDLAAQVRPLDLNAAVRDALYLLEPQLTKCGVEPAVRSVGAVSVLADPVAVEQIIHNLLLNAMQALELVPPAECVLTLTIATSMDQVVLTVRDSGPGIAADVLPRIFEPFFTTRDGGLGLGLSLCETLATGMNGSMSATNHAVRGAEFTLTLPLATHP